MSKKIMVVASIFLAFSLYGCAWMGQQVDYVQLCNADPACLADAKEKAGLVTMIATMAYPPISGAVGAATLVMALWFGGRKKGKANNG